MTFEFTYAVELIDIEPGTETHVWIPIASNNDHQQIQVLSIDVPGEYEQNTDEATGNRMAFFKAKANDRGRIPITVKYKVTRKQVTQANYTNALDEQKKKYLEATSLVPLGGKPEETFFSETKLTGTNLERAREIYGMVEGHVAYDKPEGGEWGRGDAVWVCDSKFGNCTDFHSLFISLCRTMEIPARFEIGFPIPAESGDVGGYHCWATFVNDDKWIPVDISEADKHPEKFDFFFGNLSPDRVVFSNGRDLSLVPPQSGGPINFFIYPYAEIDGKPHTQFEKHFRVEIPTSEGSSG